MAVIQTSRPIVTKTVVVHPTITPDSLTGESSTQAFRTSSNLASSSSTSILEDSSSQIFSTGIGSTSLSGQSTNTSKLFSVTTDGSTTQLMTPSIDSLIPTVPILSTSTGTTEGQPTSSNSVATFLTSHQTKKALVPIVAGSVSGICVLLIGGFLGLCVLRRQRRMGKGQDPTGLHTTPYVLHTPDYGGISEATQRNSRLVSSRMDEGGTRLSLAHPDVKSGIQSTQVSASEGGETVASMRHVTEIREEMARLKQLLVGAQRPSTSQNPESDQTAQLSDIREEIQRLRHLVSLQSAERRNDFDGVSRTSSPPAYEC